MDVNATDLQAILLMVFMFSYVFMVIFLFGDLPTPVYGIYWLVGLVMFVIPVPPVRLFGFAVLVWTTPLLVYLVGGWVRCIQEGCATWWYGDYTPWFVLVEPIVVIAISCFPAVGVWLLNFVASL